MSIVDWGLLPFGNHFTPVETMPIREVVGIELVNPIGDGDHHPPGSGPEVHHIASSLSPR